MIKRFNIKADLSRGKEEKNKNTVYGYGLNWNEIIDFGWLRETFEKGAFPEDVRTETKMLIAHQSGIPLANVAAKTMRIKEDKKGLYFEADLSETSHRASDVLDAIDRGDLTDVSVGIFLRGGKWRIEHEDTSSDNEEEPEPDLFIVEQVGMLKEISFVDMGAYTTAKIDGTRSEKFIAAYRGVMSDEDEVAVIYRAWQEQNNIDSCKIEEEKLNNRLKGVLEEIAL